MTATTPDMPSAELENAWARVQTRLKAELGETVWRSWFRNLHCISLDDRVLKLAAESKLMQSRLKSQYADRLRAHWQAENSMISEIRIGLQHRRMAASEKPVRASSDGEHAKPVSDLASTAIAGSGRAEDEAFGGVLDPRMTFEHFITDRSNELAYAAAMRTAESDSPAFNPLFLHGGVGLGKTHLMHAIAWHIRKRDPGRRVAYLSAEKFMYRFVRALRFRDTMSFKEQFRSVDVLMIDDVQFISGKDTTQEEFFHTFNALVDQNRQIIVSADKSPTDLAGMEERLRSRLGWGMVADIHPTSFELRLGILQSRAERAGIAIPEKVLEFLAHKITANIRELEGALNRITAHAQLIGGPVTIETTREVLADLLRAGSRQISIEAIQREVARHYNLRVTEMHSSRRSRHVVWPRQVAMYLAKILTASSYPEIGRHFGGRDHTTVMHAVRRVEAQLDHDAVLNEDVVLLRSLLTD